MRAQAVALHNKKGTLLTFPLCVSMTFGSACGLCKALGQTSLFAVRSVLMDNALCGSLVNRALSRAEQLDIGLVRGNGGFKLLDLGLHRRLDHPVAQVLLFGHLHALDGRLDIRQIVHLPTQIHKCDCTTNRPKFQDVQYILLLNLGKLMPKFTETGVVLCPNGHLPRYKVYYSISKIILQYYLS